MSTTNYRFFVQCSLGLEQVVRQELQAFGWECQEQEGGVELRGDWDQLVQCCLALRSADSVRVRLKAFLAFNFTDLVEQLKKLPFRAYFERGTAVEVRVTCHKSQLWHSDAVAERVYAVLEEHVGCVRGGAEGEPQTVYVRVHRDEVQVSLDAGGQKMHRRGYRPYVERASLRETLAFAVGSVVLEHKAAASAVWDPFCGAGTLLLELAHLQEGRLAGEGRRLALEQWRGHDAARFAELKQRTVELVAEQARVRFAQPLRLLGSDVSGSAVSAAKKNASSAQLEGLEWWEGDLVEVASQIPPGTAIVCNPPYGKRLSDCGGVRRLLQLVQSRADLRPVVALVGGEAKNLLPSSWQAPLHFQNGGLSVSTRVLL